MKKERGAMTIIEATFVFPITFFIVLIMIMVGEAYFQASRVEYCVTAAAVDGAACCENPMLSSVIKSKSVPTDPRSVEVMPYRYIFTGEAKKIGGTKAGELENKVKSFQPLLFRNMKPTNIHVSVSPSMNPFISSFPVECSFEIPFPIRMIFSTQNLKFSYTVRVKASVGDPAEFLRVVGLVSDLWDRSPELSEFGSKVTEIEEKIGRFLG